MRKVTVLVALIILSQVSFSYALNVGTHKAINEYIANNSLNGFSLDTYLRNNLGIQGGVTEKFKTSTVWEWLRDGGEYEDEPPWNIPYVRSLNHFHNPITEEGFKGDCLGSSLCVSSTVWALMPLGTQSLLTGNYSWYDVRDYYYKALTSSTKTERDTNFAETFRGLGQLMHLVQDASVPAHTRNDFHLFYNYEDYAGSFVKGGGVPTPPISSFFNGTINNIASFIDTNQYNGTNSAVTLLNSAGLSEYSNANFFSEDTIFSANYPNPAKENTSAQLVEVQAEDGAIDKVHYIYLNGQNYRLAAYSYFFNDLSTFTITEGWRYNLDNNVYADYASLLLPRAVGYSAGLLNYFFRGDMDFTIDANDRDDGVKGVKISNRFTEDMDGTFNLYYDTADTNRHLLGSWNISLASQGTSQVLSFHVPQDYYKYKYTLAFRGRMGTEQDAVAGYQYAGWREEWNNGLYGNHTWLYSDIDIIYSALWGDPYPAGGQTLNEVIDGKLIKENIRYAGNKYYRRNETLIMDAITISGRPNCIGQDEGKLYCFPYDFGEEFPIPITKNSWVNVKIDEISAYQIPPSQICRDPFSGNDFVAATAWQGIRMEFDNGIALFFTIQGQVSPGDATTGRWVAYIEPGKEWFYHIFTTFWNAGVEFVEPVNLLSITVEQQLAKVCGEPPATEHRQRMVVDYIRIEERPTILQSQSIIVSP